MSTSNAIHKSNESNFAHSRSPQLSSEGLSSPPRSSPEPAVSPPTQPVHNATSTSAANLIPVVHVPSTQVVKPSRRKPARKSKDPASNIDGTEAPKAKRVRKPKDPNAPPAQRRKKNLAADASSEPSLHLTDSKSNVTTVRQPLPSEVMPNNLRVHPPILPPRAGKPVQSFFNSTPQLLLVVPSQSKSQGQPVRTSGQNYDPIRSSNYDPVRETVVHHTTHHKPQASTAKSSSTSYTNVSPVTPSTTVEQQGQMRTSLSAKNPDFTNHDDTRSQQADSSSKATPNPTKKEKKGVSLSSDAPQTSKPSQPSLPKPQASVASKSQTSVKSQSSSATKKSSLIVPITGSSNLSKKVNNSTTSLSASPKLTKAKETKENNEVLFPVPPPLPGTGNGLNDGTEYRAPTVILTIPMNGEVNKYINFTRLAEQQYGWDALHPRLAAQRDRLARVAAAGAALERNGSSRDSGDEMSLDSEAEGSNGEPGGGSDGRHGNNDTKKVPKKRKMREDEYDKDDGFVDDTELLWEEQAAATNDGFFVYSGLLIPEGEKPILDTRADGTSKRGRGRGSRGGSSRTSNARGANANATATPAVPSPSVSSTNTNAGATSRSNIPATGPGSRGGPGSRKPRITKADRVRMEHEKMEREKAGLAFAPGSSKSTIPLTISQSTEVASMMQE